MTPGRQGKRAGVVGAPDAPNFEDSLGDSQDSAIIRLQAVIYYSECVYSTISKGKGIWGKDQRKPGGGFSQGTQDVLNPFSDEL